MTQEKHEGLAIAEVIAHFAERAVGEAAPEAKTHSMIEMIESASTLYEITPLEFVFHAVSTLAIATDCYSRFFLERRMDPSFVAVKLRLRTDEAPQIEAAHAYPHKKETD